MFGLICCYVDNEIYFYSYSKNQKDTPVSPNLNIINYNTMINQVFRVLAMLSTLLLIGMIYRYYVYQVEKLKIQNIVHVNTSLFHIELRNLFYLELLANIIVYPPLLDAQLTHNFNQFSYDIPFNAYFFSIMLLFRMYILLRIYQQNTFWNTAKAQRVCKMNDFNANIMFTIRVSLKINPKILISVVLMCILGVFGVAIRCIERFHSPSQRSFNFDNLWNCLWCIVLSMTTIGYGDIYPITIGGRIIVILAGLSGFLILSMLVNILSSSTILLSNEDKAYNFLVSQKMINNKLLLDSTIFIQKFYRLRRLRKNQMNLRERIQLVLDQQGLLKRLRLKRMQIRENKLGLVNQINQIGLAYEEEINKVKEEVSDLTDLKESVEKSLQLQRLLNSKTLAIFKNQKLLFDLTQQDLSEEVNQSKSIL